VEIGERLLQWFNDQEQTHHAYQQHIGVNRNPEWMDYHATDKERRQELSPPRAQHDDYERELRKRERSRKEDYES